MEFLGIGGGKFSKDIEYVVNTNDEISDGGVLEEGEVFSDLIGVERELVISIRFIF